MTIFNGTFKNTADDFKDSKSSNEYKYVMTLKSTFDRKLFPNEFDSWTVQEQCKWINKNITTFFPNVPKSLLDLIPASFRQVDCGRSSIEVPEWLNTNKYRRGQKFVRENYASLVFATILGIMHVYSFEDALKPIIISKRSHTPYLGLKRYASTIQRFFNWYNGEPWIEGTQAYKDMQFARRMHLMIQAKLCELDNEQIENESKIAELWCSDRELFLKDFSAACPSEKNGQRPYIIINKSSYRPKGMNNADTAYTQCSFISTVLLCPQNAGIHNATDEDVEAFCHMWRCYGYYLGMEDEHNFCRGSLDEIKQRTRDLYQYWILPNFKDVTPEWEHMTRCVVEPLNYYPLVYIPYKVTILLATDVLDISMPHLYASMSYAEWIAYKSWRFIFHYALKFSSFRVVFNKMISKIFDQAMNFSPEKEAEFQEKSKKQLSNFSIKH